MTLLIYPPIARPGEPPAGIAGLSGALGARGIDHQILDLNLEGIEFLLGRPRTKSDTWTRRAHRNLARHCAAIRSPELYRSLARYQRAVRDVNRALGASVPGEFALTLENFEHRSLSPLRSADLLRAADEPETNPFYPFFSERLAAVLEARPVERVGISLQYLSQALTVFSMAGFLKKRFPGLSIILGGGLVTSWVRTNSPQPLFSGLIDRFIAGPGEREFLALHGPAGTTNSEAPPDYSRLPLQDYFAPGVVLPYAGSSGCWWNKCSFCPERAEGNPYARLSAARFSDDLALLVERLRPALIHLLDNSLAVEHMRALIARPPGPPWYGFARLSGELGDDDFCAALKRSGCVMLQLGIESGDQGVLDAMGKGMTVELASRALTALARAGIAAYVYLIFGTPAETLAAARRTLEFTLRHADKISNLNLAIFNMPRHGDEAARFGKDVFYEGDLSLYTAFQHPAGWDRGLVRSFLEGEFKRRPEVAAILRREPPYFGSNHAPFFAGRSR